MSVRTIWPDLFKLVIERDGLVCRYCGSQVWLGSPYKRPKGIERKKHRAAMDHVIPRSRGGRTVAENLVVSCVGCNSKKGSEGFDIHDI